jgi:hypothetical protein
MKGLIKDIPFITKKLSINSLEFRRPISPLILIIAGSIIRSNELLSFIMIKKAELAVLENFTIKVNMFNAPE